MPSEPLAGFAQCKGQPSLSTVRTSHPVRGSRPPPDLHCARTFTLRSHRAALSRKTAKRQETAAWDTTSLSERC